MSKIVIIGGGIIGLASAYYLRKNNHEVTIIDKGIPGGACSTGNMGWVCPTLAMPVPAPGVLSTTLKSMFRADSPLYIKPSAIPSLGSWTFKFWKNCNEDSFRKGYDAGLEMSRNTFELFDEIQNEDQLDFELHKKGLLFVFLTDEALENKAKELSPSQKIGLPEPIIKSKEEALAMEPNLSNDIAGGLYLPLERHVRPESFSQGLYKWLQANDVEFFTNSEVTNLVKQGDQLVEVRTASDSFKADQFLLATGAWSGQLTKQIGYKLPMTAGKGYSITISDPTLKINQPLYLGEHSTGISPFNGATRFGGTMEMSGINTNIDQRRIPPLRKSLAKYLKKPLQGKSENIWTGMRPMTPDGLPALGKIPKFNNLYIATGHVMMGVSMSLSTGHLMSELISNKQARFDISPFSPERFAR